ncbi:site-specific DNA-methyltransferase [Serpentinicella sp. ANB-PHB4]|uniref:site-specific DNA-methyltransferase n=1 Tax=Serpentinicella sp. ANB-PHB4 TaxID=3074076 RepID=UPI00286178FA|nr:site-specific DNA-methyltransferase [Serpentinicella sp. ANB-PHB4]MDR5659976.1 site-specific DNA-methyltransferase [Serpentinicella sp. ANB-PHB4]
MDTYKFEPIAGFPMLHWKGKRPFEATQYYPAQLTEVHGEPKDNWLNKVFWGDNLQVMSHLLKEHRGKIKMIYIDPPFDSKAEYKKKIKLKGASVSNDHNSFEEKQYTDIWKSDEYLQFMYERLILLKELLHEEGTIYLHCDWHKVHYLRSMMDEIFGAERFINEIIWSYKSGGVSDRYFGRKHDNILMYGKTNGYTFNVLKEKSYNRGFKPYRFEGVKEYEDEIGWYTLTNMRDVWDLDMVGRTSAERMGYPTQKPEALLKRMIEVSTNKGDIVFDCFMGSGTTQTVAMKMDRKFIGADINLGSIQTTTKRLVNDIKALAKEEENQVPGFEVYNVNHYDVFRNPVQAKELLMEALEVNAITRSHVYDGEKDGRMVKIFPVNRIATRADLNELITHFDYKEFDRRKEQAPNKPVEKLLLICMGHEPGLAAHLQEQVDYQLDIAVVDILRDKKDIQFKRESEAKVEIKDNQIVIDQFYPMNLLQKLKSKESVGDWRELVESVMIDWNYDGAVLEPTIVDIAQKEELVKGTYDVPQEAGTIRVKITDLLSETLEVTVKNG